MSKRKLKRVETQHPETKVVTLNEDGTIDWEASKRNAKTRIRPAVLNADGSVNWAAMEGDVYAVEVARQHRAMERRAFAMHQWFDKWAAERGLS
jgi:hypothetical protein